MYPKEGWSWMYVPPPVPLPAALPCYATSPSQHSSDIKKIPCLDTVESLGNKYTVLILLQMVIDSTSTQKHWLILKRSVVLSFKKYSFNTQLCTGALGRTNWRRIVLPQSLSVHTNGISHSRQNKCYDVAVEKMPMHNQWAPRNEDCTRETLEYNQGSIRIFFLKILNCRDQLSEVRTVFLYLQNRFVICPGRWKTNVFKQSIIAHVQAISQVWAL